jgi:hypothetical protein
VNVLAQQVLKLYPDMEDAGECCMLLSSKIILYTIKYYYIILYLQDSIFTSYAIEIITILFSGIDLLLLAYPSLACACN